MKFIAKIFKQSESLMIVIPKKIWLKKGFKNKDFVELEIKKKKDRKWLCSNCGKEFKGRRVWKPKKCPFCSKIGWET